jgi:O-antigen ligase
MLDTHSIGGRVRYRGILEDPNELSWAINMAMPFAFALYERRRTLRRLLIAILAVVLGAACVIMTQSRSGQIGILATLGVYFIRRFRWRGALLGAVAAIPLLILGGRSGEGAESSSEERLNCWNEALSMWRDNPIMGVGKGQFTEHYYLTAHNSFLLSLAELGPLGLFLWSAAVYYAIKVTVQAQIQLAGRPEAATARSWSMALLASLVALVASAVFLTLTFHAILWINLGLAGALYAAIRSHEPSFRVGFGWKDVGAVAAFDVAFVSAISIYLRVHGI